jgi:hypothetical protein
MYGNRCDIPGYCVWYILEDGIKFFLVVALNDACLNILGCRIKPMTESSYIRFFLSLMTTYLWSYNFDDNGIDKVRSMIDKENKRNFVFSIKKYFKEL